MNQAEIVFEWLDRSGGSQFLAVFTRQPRSTVGPISPLSLGGLDLARTYGRVICSSLRPDAGEFLNSHRLPGPAVYRPTDKYVSLGEVLSQMKRERWQVSPAEGWRLYRRDSSSGGPAAPYGRNGSPAPEVVARKLDGTEVFSWRWNGSYYQRRIHGERVGVQAVAVLFADEESGPFDSGNFPEGVFAGDLSRALLYVDGREIPVTWSRKFSQPLSLEEASRPVAVPLPPGRVWFHIVRPYADYTVELHCLPPGFRGTRDCPAWRITRVWELGNGRRLLEEKESPDSVVYWLWDPAGPALEAIVGNDDNARLRRVEDSRLVFSARGGGESGALEFPYEIIYDLETGKRHERSLYLPVYQEVVFGKHAWPQVLTRVVFEGDGVSFEFRPKPGTVLAGFH
ncbi:MAG: hypothetical protein QME70_07945 [Bacillota bacterium]|nr:hypothetical protein [Bacillota bacterium]